MQLTLRSDVHIAVTQAVLYNKASCCFQRTLAPERLEAAHLAAHCAVLILPQLRAWRGWCDFCCVLLPMHRRLTADALLHTCTTLHELKCLTRTAHRVALSDC